MARATEQAGRGRVRVFKERETVKSNQARKKRNLARASVFDVNKQHTTL